VVRVAYYNDVFRYVRVSQKLLFILTGIVLLCSWSQAPGQQNNTETSASITSETARNLAKEEVNRRGLPLPKDCQEQVRNLFADYGSRPAQPIFAITIFSVIDGSRKNLYAVSINKQTGKVEDFLDMRKAAANSDH
jgi:hypothetical protein